MVLIGIAGKAGAGKSSLCNEIVRHCHFMGVSHAVISFADPIKEMLSCIGVQTHDAVKEQPIDWLDGLTPRKMMQSLGTEWGRALLDDMWVRVWKRSVVDESSFGTRVIVTPDVRFEDEAASIRELGGIIVHVNRPGEHRSADTFAHSSESGIAVAKCDVTVTNDRGISVLEAAACKLIDRNL